MNLPSNDSTFHLRQSMYWLLICLSVGMMLGRVMAVDAVDRTALAKDRLNRIAGELDRRKGQLQQQGLEGEALEKELARIETQLHRDAQLRRPFLSANDRSRWCTVRALVEPDMRVEGAPYAIDKVIQDPNWDTIDMVKHDGHLYSSKPPLMATLMAGIYWIIYHHYRDVAGYASLYRRADHAGDNQRYSAGDKFYLARPIGRTLWHDRLGALVRNGGRRHSELF